jgi:hypothetical protein
MSVLAERWRRSIQPKVGEGILQGLQISRRGAKRGIATLSKNQAGLLSHLKGATAEASVELVFGEGENFQGLATYIGRGQFRDAYRVMGPVPQLGNSQVVIKFERQQTGPEWKSSCIMEWDALMLVQSVALPRVFLLEATEAFGEDVIALVMESSPTTADEQYLQIGLSPFSPHSLAYVASMVVEATHLVVGEWWKGASFSDLHSSNVGLRVSFAAFKSYCVGHREASITLSSSGPAGADFHPLRWPALGMVAIDAEGIHSGRVWNTEQMCHILDDILGDMVTQLSIVAECETKFSRAADAAQALLCGFFAGEANQRDVFADEKVYLKLMVRFRRRLAEWYRAAIPEDATIEDYWPVRGTSSQRLSPWLTADLRWPAEGADAQDSGDDGEPPLRAAVASPPSLGEPVCQLMASRAGVGSEKVATLRRVRQAMASRAGAGSRVPQQALRQHEHSMRVAFGEPQSLGPWRDGTAPPRWPMSPPMSGRNVDEAAQELTGRGRNVDEVAQKLTGRGRNADGAAQELTSRSRNVDEAAWELTGNSSLCRLAQVLGQSQLNTSFRGALPEHAGRVPLKERLAKKLFPFHVPQMTEFESEQVGRVVQLLFYALQDFGIFNRMTNRGRRTNDVASCQPQICCQRVLFVSLTRQYHCTHQPMLSRRSA